MALILIADDDPLVGDIVRYTLAERGHVVGIVETGHDALRVVVAKQPDLVILDCSMPDLSGVEVLRHLRVSGTAFHVPILMLTAGPGATTRTSPIVQAPTNICASRSTLPS